MRPSRRWARGTPPPAGPGGALEFGNQSAGAAGGAELPGEFLGLVDGELSRQGGGSADHVVCPEQDDLGGMQGLRHLECDPVGVHAVGAALAVEAERRDHRNDPFLEKEFQGVVVHTLDPSGVELVGPPEDACGMGDDGVGVGGTQVDRRQPLHDPVGEPYGGVDGKLQGGLVGDSRPVGVGCVYAAAPGQVPDLTAGPVDQNHPHAQRAKDREVEEDIREIFRCGDRTVHGDHEDPLLEAGDVLEDFAEVGDVHWGGC